MMLLVVWLRFYVSIIIYHSMVSLESFIVSFVGEGEKIGDTLATTASIYIHLKYDGTFTLCLEILFIKSFKPVVRPLMPYHVSKNTVHHFFDFSFIKINP